MDDTFWNNKHITVTRVSGTWQVQAMEEDYAGKGG